MSQKSCPNCGAALPEMFAHARMVNCEFCGSSVVLEDDVLRKAGEAGAMLDAPELITLGRAVRLPEGEFTAWGHVRYDYGRGHWDEYHGALDGELVWVSVDEGDVVLQRPMESEPSEGRALFRVGASFEAGDTTFTCTEVANAIAVAFRGQLPEPIELGDTHLYANFSGTGGALVSGEYWEGGSSWFIGHWIDPFEVRTA
ncbi:protein of unknown function [Jannaschia faecimaris]|uniref:DUF4178 domain-containing protein n=1 Tax=Jannaschia faecimaris TaxID=1244108 RepID=A0A1H3QA74_9RHOB|nr:DUF4178 domain-containing protein [Jannaschia faecimaris]SDZ09925.1 protein of unknown function [Jannaschia faecimaris]